MKKKVIVLDKLAHDSAADLESMIADLNGQSEPQESSRWSKRFAASGKGSCMFAPKIRAN